MSDLGTAIVLFLCIGLAIASERYFSRERKLKRAYLAAVDKGRPLYVLRKHDWRQDMTDTTNLNAVEELQRDLGRTRR